MEVQTAHLQGDSIQLTDFSVVAMHKDYGVIQAVSQLNAGDNVNAPKRRIWLLVTG